MIRVQRHESARAFLERAEPWLLQAEAEHNLLLGLAHELVTSTARYTPPIYLATIEENGAVVGCAFRTPPYKLGLTRMPEAALPLLTEDLTAVYDQLPAALGPERETRLFAELWSRARGVEAHPGMHQRIYQLNTVTPLARMPTGQMRRPEHRDLDLLAEWSTGFYTDTGLPSADPRQQAMRWIEGQNIFIWDDGQPVSMAGWTGRTPHGARIAYVYTPPAHRGQGYASACTAALSQRLLDAGLSFCFLYTDLSNPTSNSIYQRIGYYPVCDVRDYDFVEQGA